MEQLAAALAERLVADRAADPLAPAVVVVPNAGVASFLKLAIARSSGIAANIELPFLESYLAGLAGGTGLSVLDRGQLHAVLCSALADRELLAADVLAPVRAYLGDDGDDLRRFQLAGQLASLFTEYELARPELVQGWPRGTALTDGPHAQTEAWQRALWLAVFGPDGILAGTGADWVPLPRLLDRLHPDQLTLPPRLALFGFSYLAPAYYKIFARLAELTRVDVYALNPCRQFWEDSAGRGDADAIEQEALRLWGRPGRENVRMLDQLAGFDFEDRFATPDRGTALGRLQADILDRNEEPDAEPLAADDSVRILACPSVVRELEIIGSEIWRLVRDDDSLQLNQIGVLINPSVHELYQAHVGAVFGELHDLPHHVLDAPLASESRISEAFELLLDLPLGQFTRPQLLGILTHPAVIGRFPDVDPNDWIHWTEALGVVHGADRSDHEGTYISRDVFNWDQGIVRLALGAFMARGAEPVAVAFGNTDYVPEPLAQGEQTSAARMALLARSLIADARFCQTAEMPLADWRGFLELIIDGYLTARTDADERSLVRCQQAVGRLLELDLDGRPVPYRIACELVRSNLASLRGARGEPLARGVTVAPLMPMRALPFRVLFLAGLGEGSFPTRDRESPLDLRTAAPRAGDVGPRERDRYLFLESVLAARDKLYLSHVARDEQTGESLEPASVVIELQHMLGAYLTDEARDAVTVRHPLRGYDPRYFPELFPHPVDRPLSSASPAAHRQAQALAIRRHLAQATGAALTRADEVRARIDPEAWQALDRRLELSPPQVPEPDSPEVVALPLWALRRFLEHPEQAWAQVVLGLRESDADDRIARADEPFEVDRLSQATLLRAIFADHLRAGDDRARLLARYRDQLALLEKTGRVPIGPFAELARRRQEAILERWRDAVDDCPAGDWRSYDFGRAAEHATDAEILPPVVVDVPRASGAVTRVELYGRTDLVGAPGSLVLVTAQSPRFNHRLRGFVDQLALAASGRREDGHGALVASASGKSIRLELAPIDRETATAYLRDRLAELLDQPHDYLLPGEVAFDYHKKPGPIAPLVERWRKNAERLGFGFGPLERLTELRMLPQDEAAAIIAARLGPFFERAREVK